VTNLGYILAAWGATFATGAVYALHLVRRGRRLSAQVPAERRRWMSTNDEPQS